jgi:cation transport regulator ChaB
MPREKSQRDVPSTLKRSPKKAQETWTKTHDAAVDEYGEGERAHRTAFSSLKHSFEKVGDHWEAKDHRGPSDPQAKKDTRHGSQRPGKTYGGVDVEGRTKEELLQRARKLGIKGRSSMNKAELAEAINRANTRQTAKARG